MKSYMAAVSLLPQELKNELMAVSDDKMCKINEIRLRSFRAVSFIMDGTIMYLCKGGRLSAFYPQDGFILTPSGLEEAVGAICRYSVHSYTECINRGYVTLPGGHRAGICGTASVKDGEISAVRCFSSVNIRIAREYIGCSRELIERTGECHSFLIVGSPMSGKTTLLRDICRYFAGDELPITKKIAVIDERDEIAALAAGGEGRNLGINTDVLSLYPKGVGIEIALRCFSPDIIVLDEIGGVSEAEKILEGVNSGVDFIATAHASSVSEVLTRPQIKMLLESGAFKKTAVLCGRDHPCRVKEVYDSREILRSAIESREIYCNFLSCDDTGNMVCGQDTKAQVQS